MTKRSDMCINRRDLMKAGAATAAVAALGSLNYTPVGAQETKKVTLIQGIQNDQFYISMACGAQAAADERGLELTVQAGEKWDASIQTSLLNAVVQAKPDAILIAPNDRVAMISPLKDAKDAGIAIFTVDTFIEDDSVALANIASDNVLGGTMAADSLAALIGETGKVYVSNTIAGTSTTDQRAQGFEEQIANLPEYRVRRDGLQQQRPDHRGVADQCAVAGQS